MNSRLALAVAAALALQGCVKTYVAPKGVKTARVNVSASGDLRLCTQNTQYALSRSPDNYVEVPSGERITLTRSFYSQGYNVSHSCTAGISFIPAAGQSYYADFDLRSERCILLVFRELPESRVGVGLEHSLGKRDYCAN